jgi:hypothetical protein
VSQRLRRDCFEKFGGIGGTGFQPVPRRLTLHEPHGLTTIDENLGMVGTKARPGGYFHIKACGCQMRRAEIPALPSFLPSG